MSVDNRQVLVSPGARIFVPFGRWPLVPADELQRLQSALRHCMELAESESAQELLLLVTNELDRRTLARDGGVVRGPSGLALPPRPPGCVPRHS